MRFHSSTLSLRFQSNKRHMREFGNLLINERAPAIPLLQAAFREFLGSRSVHGPDENGDLANFSTVELVSLRETLVGCPRLYDFVPESSRHYLENM